MHFEFEVPLDDDGYLDRECPSCERRFRWHDGPTEDAPPSQSSSDHYYCPYCGASAPLDEWWTTEQIEAAQQIAIEAAAEEVGRQFKEVARNSKHHEYRSDLSAIPPPGPLELDEIDSLVAVASPCHGYEPVKVLTAWRSALYCLICGEPYSVA